MKFKPGDRFKVVGNLPNNQSLEGKLGTVVKVHPDMKGCFGEYEVRIDSGGYHTGWKYDGDMLPKGSFPFKVGDIVQAPDGSIWKFTNLDDYKLYGECIKSGTKYSKGSSGQSDVVSDYKLVSKSGMLQKLTAMLKRMLDSNSQTLYKAGFINGDLKLTDEGQEALLAVLFDANKDALVKEAQIVIDEATEDDK